MAISEGVIRRPESAAASWSSLVDCERVETKATSWVTFGARASGRAGGQKNSYTRFFAVSDKDIDRLNAHSSRCGRTVVGEVRSQKSMQSVWTEDETSSGGASARRG